MPQCPNANNCACAIETRHFWFDAFCVARDTLKAVREKCSKLMVNTTQKTPQTIKDVRECLGGRLILLEAMIKDGYDRESLLRWIGHTTEYVERLDLNQPEPVEALIGHIRYCNANDPISGAVCHLPLDHKENHRGPFAHGVSQWPYPDATSSSPTHPPEPVQAESCKGDCVLRTASCRSDCLGRVPEPVEALIGTWRESRAPKNPKHVSVKCKANNHSWCHNRNIDESHCECACHYDRSAADKERLKCADQLAALYALQEPTQ